MGNVDGLKARGTEKRVGVDGGHLTPFRCGAPAPAGKDWGVLGCCDAEVVGRASYFLFLTGQRSRSL